MFSKIAIAVHRPDADARDAIALGVMLARTSGAPLVLTSVWVSPLGPGDGFYDKALRGEAERVADLLMHEIPDDVAASTCVHGSTSVAKGLHEIADEEDVDLLVLGPSHLGGLARRVRGDISIAAMHDAPCAIVVAERGRRHRDPVLRDITVSYDASPEAELALDTAIDLAEASAAALRIVRVVDTPYAFNADPWIGAGGTQHYLHAVTDEARTTLDHAREKAAGRVSVTTELREGITGRELVDAAGESDLMVAGSRGFGALSRLVFGSTAAALLRHAPCPVLVTPRGATDRESVGAS